MVQDGRLSMAGNKTEKQTEQLLMMQLKTQAQLDQLVGFDQHQAHNLEDELTKTVRLAIEQLEVDQVEDLSNLRQIGHPFKPSHDLTEADGLLLVTSGSQQVLVYISAKYTITSKLVAKSVSQMGCYRQLLSNIHTAMAAGDYLMTDQAVLLKDLPMAQTAAPAHVTTRFQAACRGLSVVRQPCSMVGFIGSANMLEDGGIFTRKCREAGMVPIVPSGASFTLADGTDLKELLFGDGT